MASNELLTKLVQRNEVLKPIVSKGFPVGTGELDIYVSQYQTEYDEYSANFQEIQRLEWELKTPEEQAEELERDRLFKAKRSGGLLL